VADRTSVNGAQARIAERRAALVVTAEFQREALRRSVFVWSRPLTLVDRGLAAFRFVSNHPAWIVGSALVSSPHSPGRLRSWLRRAFLAFKTVRRIRSAALR
jgi:hypothetical protein